MYLFWILTQTHTQCKVTAQRPNRILSRHDSMVHVETILTFVSHHYLSLNIWITSALQFLYQWSVTEDIWHADAILSCNPRSATSFWIFESFISHNGTPFQDIYYLITPFNNFRRHALSALRYLLICYSSKKKGKYPVHHT